MPDGQGEDEPEEKDARYRNPPRFFGIEEPPAAEIDESSARLRCSSNGQMHVEVDGTIAFTQHGERKTVLCGAALSGTGLRLRGNRLVDEYRRGNVCSTCLDRLREMNASISGFMRNGEILDHV